MRRLALSTLTLDDLATLTLDELAAMSLDPLVAFGAGTVAVGRLRATLGVRPVTYTTATSRLQATQGVDRAE